MATIHGLYKTPLYGVLAQHKKQMHELKMP